jgi:predicted DNA-binding protein
VKAEAMYTTYIVRRTQIYLEDEQIERLERRARASGVTRSTLIRDAIDRMLDAPEDEASHMARFREAVDATFGVAPELAAGDEYIARLRAGDARRLR